MLEGFDYGGDLHIVSDELELRTYFSERLEGLGEDVRNYVSVLMTDFVYNRGNNLVEVLFSETLERVGIQKFSEAKDFVSLKDMGDTFLWMSGFLPEHVIDKNCNKPRFMLTLEDYISYGKMAYYQASLIRSGEFPIKEISKGFEWVAHSILNMRWKMNPGLRYQMQKGTVEEIERVLNDGNPIFDKDDLSLIIIN